MKKSNKIYFPKTLQKLFLGLFLFNIIWLVFAIIFNNQVLPNPILVYKIMPETMSKGMALHAFASAWRVLLGTSLSLLIGVVIGVFMALNKMTNRLLEPLLYLSYPVPKLALLPVVMIVFGIGDLAKIIMIVLIIVFQLIISIRDAVKNIPKENYYVLSSLGANWMQHLRHIVMPATLPHILSALRVTIGIAVSVLFVTETFGTDRGLGFFIVDSWMRLDYLTMYAGIVMLSIIGFIFFMLIDVADIVFCNWNKLQAKE